MYFTYNLFFNSRLINSKGRKLCKALLTPRNKLDFISPGMLTCWPTDRRMKPDLTDFAVTRHPNPVPNSSLMTIHSS